MKKSHVLHGVFLANIPASILAFFLARRTLGGQGSSSFPLERAFFFSVISFLPLAPGRDSKNGLHPREDEFFFSFSPQTDFLPGSSDCAPLLKSDFVSGDNGNPRMTGTRENDTLLATARNNRMKKGVNLSSSYTLESTSVLIINDRWPKAPRADLNGLPYFTASLRNIIFQSQSSIERLPNPNMLRHAGMKLNHILTWGWNVSIFTIPGP